jgi:hypothetical protein
VRPAEENPWFAVGIAGSAASSAKSRFLHLLEECGAAIPDAEAAPFQDWQDFALRWGTWVRLRWQTAPDRDARSEKDAIALTARVEADFSQWILRRFGPMASLPYLPRPVLGHHVPHYLAHRLGQSDTERIAQLVIDMTSTNPSRRHRIE